MKIFENFLPQEDFDKLQNIMMGPQFLWHYNPIIDFEDDIDKFQFTHNFFDSRPLEVSSFLGYVSPIQQKLGYVSLLRIKANLLTKTSSIIKNTFHVDILDFIDFPEKLKQWTTSIFYENTNNGYTEFEDGTKVESVANRMVTFPANLKHRGTSCTDEKTRVVINFNYFK